MATVWCFQCGAEYVDEVDECVECGVPTTTDEPARPEDVGSEEEEQLAYELHEWSGEGRRVLDGILTTEGIAHSWQGATLIVREADENWVDTAVRQAELATLPTLSPGQATMVYELDEYNDEHRTRLVEVLGIAGIAHEFDAQGDLVVHEADEDEVDRVFEGLEAPPDEAFEFGPGVEGVGAHDVLSDLFLAVSKLRKDASDSKTILSFVRTSELAEQLELPFGFSGADWRALLDDSIAVREVLVADGIIDDDDLRDNAEVLYARLRPLI